MKSIKVWNADHTTSFDYVIELSKTVKDLKTRISEIGFQINSKQQKLFFEGKELRNDYLTLKICGILSGSVLEVHELEENHVTVAKAF